MAHANHIVRGRFSLGQEQRPPAARVGCFADGQRLRPTERCVGRFSTGQESPVTQDGREGCFADMLVTRGARAGGR